MCVLGVCRLFICEVTEPSPLRGSAACARRAAYPDRDLGSCGRLGESSNTWKHFGPEPTKAQYSVISVLVRQETGRRQSGGAHQRRGAELASSSLPPAPCQCFGKRMVQQTR